MRSRFLAVKPHNISMLNALKERPNTPKKSSPESAKKSTTASVTYRAPFPLPRILIALRAHSAHSPYDSPVLYSSFGTRTFHGYDLMGVAIVPR
jgi:hypothetical protein